MSEFNERIRNISAENMAGFWEFPSRRMHEPVARLTFIDVSVSDTGTTSSLTRNATLLRRPEAHELSLVASAVVDFFQTRPGATFSINSHWPQVDFRKHNFGPTGISAVMWREPGLIRVPDLEDFVIEEVTSSSALMAWERVFITGFPIEGLLPFRPQSLFKDSILGDRSFRLWLGYQGDQPVSAATSYVGEAVGIYNVSTLPAARGRGYGSAVTAAAIKANYDKPSVLQADDDVQRLYGRLGYKSVADFTFWRYGS